MMFVMNYFLVFLYCDKFILSTCFFISTIYAINKYQKLKVFKSFSFPTKRRGFVTCEEYQKSIEAGKSMEHKSKYKLPSMTTIIEEESNYPGFVL